MTIYNANGERVSSGSETQMARRTTTAAWMAVAGAVVATALLAAVVWKRRRDRQAQLDEAGLTHELAGSVQKRIDAATDNSTIATHADFVSLDGSSNTGNNNNLSPVMEMEESIEQSYAM